MLSLPTFASADQGRECSFLDPLNLHFHSEKVFLVFDGDDSVRVHEATAYRDNKEKPVEGEVVVDNDKRTTYKWELRYFFSNSVSARILYRFSYYKGTGKAHLSARATGGYVNRSDADGTCNANNIDESLAAGTLAGRSPQRKQAQPEFVVGY